MHLSRLYIENYKSIKKLDLKFNKGKNIIVGKNNSGKSNIVNAIDLVLGENVPHYEGYENITKNDFFGGIEKSQTIIIKCILERDVVEELDLTELKKCFFIYHKERSHNNYYNPGHNYKMDLNNIDQIENLCFNENYKNKLNDTYYKWWVGNCEYGSVSYDLIFKNVDKFAFIFVAKFDKDLDSIKKELLFLFKENGDDLWVIGFGGTNLRNYLIQSAIIPSFRDPKDQLRITNYSWYGKLLRHYINEDDHELQKAFAEVKKVSDKIFKNSQDKILGDDIKIAFPNTQVSFQFNPDTKQDIYKSTLIYVDDGFNSKLEEKGSGIQSAVIIGLFDFYIRNVAHKSGSSLLAVEEPELYLHPHGKRVISNRLDAFINNGKNQVIITTHSPEFICTPHENINLIVVRKNKETNAINFDFDDIKIKQILIKKENAELFFADAVILTEGADKYILESIAYELGKKVKILKDEQELMLGKNWINDYNVSVINCGGKTQFSKYVEVLEDLRIPWMIISDFDFMLKGLNQFIETIYKDKNTGIMEIKNKINALSSKLTDYYNKDIVKKSVSQFIENLIFNKILPNLNSSKKKKIKKSIVQAIKNARSEKKFIDQITDERLKQEVINFLLKLREEYNIYILEGELEDYYIIKPGYNKEAGVLELLSNLIEENKKIEDYIDIDAFNNFLKIFIKNCLNLEIVE